MRILYIFPHPDDESFGAAHAISWQRRKGHEVYLLTLTRGGATRQRHKYGYSVQEMGEARYQEMLCVARVLDLSGMNVLDLPDSGLKHMDPREIEAVVAAEIERLQPHVVVTYAVHGISGYQDHLVTHAVVKRVYVELAERVTYLKRLAFYTLTEENAASSKHAGLKGSKPEEIGCVVEVEAVDLARAQQALDCYVTYQDAIQETGIRESIRSRVAFEVFGEQHDPPLANLVDELA
jgi:LmbE family N-acetylglucosaminyl deacetylase